MSQSHMLMGVVLLFSAPQALAGASTLGLPAPAAPQRFIQSLDGPWRFYPAFEEIRLGHKFLEAGTGANRSPDEGGSEGLYGWIEPHFDDSSWWVSQVPESWNTAFEDLHSYEGQGWYRKNVLIPLEWAGKRILFCSDGANYRTVVYVNGVKAGVHEGGYLPFQVRIDSYVTCGEKNVIAIAVDNESRLERVPMERHDWWNHGGLYRPVRLMATSQHYMDALSITTDVLRTPATLTAQVTLHAPGAAKAPGLLVARLRDGQGTEVAALGKSASVSEGASPIDLLLSVPDAQYWSPDAPYLYTLTLELYDAAGACLDTLETTVGFRTITVTPAGLLLNGKPFLVKGLNRYENYPDTGMTSTEENLTADITAMKALDANAVRCHYPNSEMTYAHFDRAGLCAAVEVPLYQWGRPGHSEENLKAAKAQLEEMIAQLGNHPSIIFWSVSNENRIFPREPGEEHRRLSEMVARGNIELVDLAHALDPSRPVIEPSNRWPSDVVLSKTDLNSVNVYLGVEPPRVSALPGVPDRVQSAFAELRSTHPGKPILVTEFGSWGLSGLMTDYFPGEVYQAELLKTYWNAFMKEPDFAGGFIWVFADSDVHRKYTSLYEMRCAYGLYSLNRTPKASVATVREMWKSKD